MKDLPYLINLPPFMYRGVEVENFSLFQKIKFILKGQLTIFVIKKQMVMKFFVIRSISYMMIAIYFILINFMLRTIEIEKSFTRTKEF